MATRENETPLEKMLADQEGPLSAEKMLEAVKRRLAEPRKQTNGAQQSLGRKLGSLHSQVLSDLIAKHGYEEGQIGAEIELLVESGMPRREARNVANSWRAALQNWFDEIDNCPNDIIWTWGSANTSALSHFPGMNEVITLISMLGHSLVLGESTLTGKPRRTGVLHGSSTTGIMGVEDMAFLHPNLQLSDEEQVPIYNIPLNWISLEVTEIPSKSGKKVHRCPPIMRLVDRTELFGRKVPTGIVVGPGGLGTSSELFWSLLSSQLRELLLTVFTGLSGNLPEVFLLDCYQDLSAMDEKRRARFRKLEGFESTWQRMVLGR